MMKDYIFKQVPPEHQKNYIFEDDFNYGSPEEPGALQGLEFIGDRWHQGRTFDRDLIRARGWSFTSCARDLEYMEPGDTVTSIIEHYYPPEEYGRKKYSTQDIKRLREAFQAYNNYCRMDSYEMEIINIVTRRNFERGTLRGCCQGDYIDIIYDADIWSPEDLQRLEADYWNTGREYLEEDTNESIYVYSYDDDGIRRELAEAVGANTDEIEIYNFTGWSRTPEYCRL